MSRVCQRPELRLPLLPCFRVSFPCLILLLVLEGGQLGDGESGGGVPEESGGAVRFGQLYTGQRSRLGPNSESGARFPQRLWAHSDRQTPGGEVHPQIGHRLHHHQTWRSERGSPERQPRHGAGGTPSPRVNDVRAFNSTRLSIVVFQDTLYQGSISRDQVAEVAVGALRCPESSFKVVEIIGSGDAPKRSLSELFGSIRSR